VDNLVTTEYNVDSPAGADPGTDLDDDRVSVRQRIDRLITDSINESSPGDRQSHEQGDPADHEEVAAEVQDLTAQVHELTLQVGALATMIRGITQGRPVEMVGTSAEV